MRILCLEDDPAAAELIQAVLEDHGRDCFLQRVETRDAFLESLLEGEFDLVLADFALPSFDGMAALKLAREHAPDLPFIFVSGSLGEEVAIETLKTGATDYLLKGNLNRLVPAIDRALRETRERCDRRLALAFLQESEERFRLLIENSNDLVAEISLDGACIYASPNHLEILGYPSEMLVGKNLLGIVHPGDLQRVTGKLKEERTTVTYRVRCAEGSWRWMDSSGQRFRTSAGVEHAVIISRDISERREADVKLLEQARLLELATDAIIVCDLDDTVRFWNQAAVQTYGWPAAEAVGRKLPDLIKPELISYTDSRAELLKYGQWSGELRLKKNTGEDVDASFRIRLVQDAQDNPESVLAIGTDITEKKVLEAQFFKAQRLESVGLLASSIAHDLNNILAPILMAAPLLKMENLSADNIELLNTIEISAKRGADMVKQILSFTRGTETGRMPMEIRLLLGEMTRLVRETFPRSIHMQSNIAKNLWPVLGGATQLHQVLLNLCINARDAMSDGGTLSIEAENVLLGEKLADGTPTGRQVGYVMIRIRDTGTGIPEELREKVFEPFFTTKELGKGTGLGLASVKNILSRHGGYLTLASQVDKGTVFEIFLPSSNNPDAGSTSADSPEIPRGNGELILVVDNEPQIREVSRRVLEMNGYEVETAGDGVEAIAVFARNRDSMKLLITATDMPRMDGKALIRVLLKMRPDLKVIASGGQLSEADRKAFDSLPVASFLEKPCLPEKLLTVTHDVLTANPRNGDPS